MKCNLLGKKGGREKNYVLPFIAEEVVNVKQKLTMRKIIRLKSMRYKVSAHTWSNILRI